MKIPSQKQTAFHGFRQAEFAYGLCFRLKPILTTGQLPKNDGGFKSGLI